MGVGLWVGGVGVKTCKPMGTSGPIGTFARLIPRSPVPLFVRTASLSLPVPHPPDQLTEPAGGLGGGAAAFAEEDEDFLAAE